MSIGLGPQSDWRDFVGTKVPNASGSARNLHFNSYAGTDIQCFLFTYDDKRIKKLIESSGQLTADAKRQAQERVSKSIKFAPFGELQTVSISIASSTGPIRRLGEREVVEYKSGARTVAGSLIFALLNRDVFAAFMKSELTGLSKDTFGSPDYVDELPPFNILIQGGNEFGAEASGLLTDVKLTNFGTTFSVDDLYTESTYNYVARHYVPFTDDWRNTISQQILSRRLSKPLSQALVDDTVYFTHNGKTQFVDRELYSWLQTLPPAARENLTPYIAQIQDQLFKIKNESQ